MNVKKVPPQVIEKISLKEPQQEKRTIKVIFDKKQFSVKLPRKIAIELGLKKGDTFEAVVEDGTLKLRLR